jgi:hypothetical protein
VHEHNAEANPHIRHQQQEIRSMTSHSIGTLEEHLAARSELLGRALRARDDEHLPTTIAWRRRDEYQTRS